MNISNGHKIESALNNCSINNLMKPNLWLVLSSLSFLAPAITCYRSSYYGLSGIYILVTTISSSYHLTKKPSLVYLDYSLSQLAHLLTVHRILKGGWVSMSAYSVWLSYAVFIYYYGYLTKTLVWNPDLDAATPWHMTLHMSTAGTTCYTVWATFNHLRKA